MGRGLSRDARAYLVKPPKLGNSLLKKQIPRPLAPPSDYGKHADDSSRREVYCAAAPTIVMEGAGGAELRAQSPSLGVALTHISNFLCPDKGIDAPPKLVDALLRRLDLEPEPV